MKRIVCLGEAMLRFTPTGKDRLEQAHAFDVHCGGAELNTGIALAQLGHAVDWVSRLPDSPLGRLLAGRLRETGVSIRHVQWAKGERLGLFFLEEGASPRPSAIEYDRADSAAARMHSGCFDWQAIFTGADWFHVSGITAAISASAGAVVTAAMQLAHAQGIPISFDPNFRSKLWLESDARAWYLRHLPLVHTLITSPEDAVKFFGLTMAEPEELLAGLAERYQLKAVAFTFRKGQSVWQNSYGAMLYHANRLYRSREYSVEIVDRIGAGDAFAAGLIDGLLSADAGQAVEYGAALGALKHTIPGDYVRTTRAEVADVAAGANLRVKR
jgi:2-dehydro-3-deoxygluconokinase